MSTQVIVATASFSNSNNHEKAFDFQKANEQFNLELEIAKEEIRLLRKKISSLQIELNAKSGSIIKEFADLLSP